MEQPLEFRVRLDGDDAEEIDIATRELLGEIRDLPVDSADLASDGAAIPPGTKAVDSAMLEVLIKVGPPVLMLVVETLNRKLKLHGGSIRFEGRLGGSPVKFEGSGEEFKQLLSTLTGKTRSS
jgi:hypothetical protein